MISLSILGTIAFQPTGSRHICDPPVTGTDEDYIVHVEDVRTFALNAITDGYQIACKDSCAEMSNFLSLRKGDINLIITGNGDFYQRFVAATAVAKRLNLLNKTDRIALFQAVLYGNTP